MTTLEQIAEGLASQLQDALRGELHELGDQAEEILTRSQSVLRVGSEVYVLKLAGQDTSALEAILEARIANLAAAGAIAGGRTATQAVHKVVGHVLDAAFAAVFAALA